jgi:hypothetical protein
VPQSEANPFQFQKAHNMTQQIAVEAWFGAAFHQLHPMLQQLHMNGGTLAGTVEVTMGRGLAGLVGKRLARQLGIPPANGATPLTVHIHSSATALHWDRTFGNEPTFASIFTPVGVYPSGYWIEASGPLRLDLGVAIVDGGWEWRQRGGRIWGIPIPAWLLPRTTASKTIKQGAYHFTVRVSAALLGDLLSYSGKLT